MYIFFISAASNGSSNYEISNCYSIFLLTLSNLIHGEIFYIVPSKNALCPKDPCLTLSQFAVNSSNYIGRNTEVSLYILPGNHNLKCQVPSDTLGECTIKCTRQFERFVLINVTTVRVEGLHFVGCGENNITNVKCFVLQDTSFQQVESIYILQLHKVMSASVIDSY